MGSLNYLNNDMLSWPDWLPWNAPASTELSLKIANELMPDDEAVGTGPIFYLLLLAVGAFLYVRATAKPHETRAEPEHGKRPSRRAPRGRRHCYGDGDAWLGREVACVPKDILELVGVLQAIEEEGETDEQAAEVAKSSVQPADDVSSPKSVQMHRQLDSEDGFQPFPGLVIRRHRLEDKPAGLALHIVDMPPPDKPASEDSDALAAVAAVIIDHAQLEVELVLEGGKQEGKSSEAPPEVRTEGMLSGCKYSEHVVDGVPAPLAKLFGLSQEDAGTSVDTLRSVLDIAQPDRIRLPGGLLPRSNDKLVVPVTSMPLAKAGAELYHPVDGQSIGTLEIGPWFPVETATGRFAMSEWQVDRVVVRYHGGDLLPSLVWDSQFGFEGMMNNGSNFILLVDAPTTVKQFRKQVRLLARAHSGAEGQERLYALKGKMYFCCEPHDRGELRSKILPVWSGEGDPLHEHRASCTCGAEDG